MLHRRVSSYHANNLWKIEADDLGGRRSGAIARRDVPQETRTMTNSTMPSMLSR